MAYVLEKEDVDLFYKLYSSLLCFVNKQAKILQQTMLSPDEFVALSLEKQIEVRNALYSQKEYIDQFIQNEDAQDLNSDELAIISSWKHFKKGRFFIYKHFKKHSIFLDDSGSGIAFAVSGISEPLEEMFPYPPLLVETILVPFKDRIIYDGLIAKYPIRFGSGFRSTIREGYEKAKHNFGLITQLPV